MFTGFASENIPAIQVWDFSRAHSGTQVVSLSDDCAPIQVFQTGGGSSSIRVYLPTCPIEGKQITIINAKYSNSNNQFLELYASDLSGSGSKNSINLLGPGNILRLCYSKNFISTASVSAAFATGWISLDQSAVSNHNAYSLNIGGNNNTAGAQYSTAIGGQGNNAPTTFATVCGGQQNTAQGAHSSTVGGITNSATGSYSFAGGGQGNSADASQSSVVGGQAGNVRSIIGNFVIPASNAPITNFSGRQQLATLLIARQTTDATATRLTSDSNAAGTTNQVILPNNSAYYFRGECIAGVTGAGDTKGWYIEGVIKRGAGVGTTALVGTPSVTSLYADAGAATWAVTATADTTNGGLAITVTGAAATTIRWVCQIRTTEMTF